MAKCMFTPEEVDYLKKELSVFIDKAQQRIAQGDLQNEQRTRIENKLITTVSIVNKLTHLQPDDEKKSASDKVLIVDDVESMRKIHRHYFMECGFKHVDLAPDGYRAFLMMKKAYENGSAYQLIVSDWEMPKVSGLELLKMTRTDAELWRTPFYLISSLNDKKHIIKGINTGATGYMVKPVNQKMVSDKFKAYLS